MLMQKLLLEKTLLVYFNIVNGIDLTIGVGTKGLGVNIIKTHQPESVN